MNMRTIDVRPILALLWFLGSLAALIAGSARASEPADVAVRPPEMEVRVAMRDGAKLLTYVNLPAGEGPFPTVLVRTPYLLSIGPRHNPVMDDYLEAGYAVVWQLARGIGDNDGRYRFVADDRNDGYDCIAWIADQPWSDGNVGMDHGSYNAMTQLQAASTAPPALKAIIPFVPSSHFFRETPYSGGIFMRYHMLNWHKLLRLRSFEETGIGFMDSRRALDDPQWQRMLASRPLIDAANGYLDGDELAQYRRFLAEPTLDSAYWRETMMMDEHYANVGIPVLLVSGNFDPTTGTLHAWRELEENAPNPQNRKLLIGPWNHGGSYVGIPPAEGPYQFNGTGVVDMSALRIAFFDRYLKGLPASVSLPQRVRVFVTGSNVWREFDSLPVPGLERTAVYLASEGEANSVRGNGSLRFAPGSDSPFDTMIADPENPVVAVTDMMSGIGEYSASHQDDAVLVYDSEPLAEPMTVIGESLAVIHVTTSTPDADLVVNLHEVHPDGRAIRLGYGGSLRLRYHQGFDRQVPLEPGRMYPVEVPLAYVGHTLAVGNVLRVTVSGTEFPVLDPNPNTGEPIATATRMQVSQISIHHDEQRLSRVELPVVDL